MIFNFTPKMARSFLYGGGSALLLLDVFFLLRGAFTDRFVPIVPIMAGILTAAGLLFIVYSEQKAREEDKRSHRRISRVAHQLMNPLKHLQENINHLVGHADKLPPEDRMEVKQMETKTKVLLNNIRDVFLTLQATEGPISQNIRVYNVCVLIQEACERVSKLASARNVELIHKLHCSQASVKLDKRLFMIALTHVLENAIYYNLSPGLVNVAVIKGTKQVRVVVQDRGLGIKDKDRKTVWQPFSRGAEAHKKDPDGIGIGLPLSRLIIKEFNGQIRYSDRKKAPGSQFEIILPLVQKG